METSATASTTASGGNPEGSSTGAAVDPDQRTDFCTESNVQIPTGMDSPASLTLVIEEDAMILDLDVRVRVNHENATGVSVSLMRNGEPPLPLVDGSEIECEAATGIVFDDDAELPSSQWCASVDGTPTVQPTQSLASYNETSIAGTWTIEVFDRNELPGGSITNWCISAILE